MSGYIDSEAVLAKRCAEIGIDDVMLRRLLAAGYPTMGMVAYSNAYPPGAGDDRPLLDWIQAVKVSAPTAAETAQMRRLFFESFTMVQQDLRLRIERAEEAAPRKLANPERIHRYEAQVKRLPRLFLRGELECADSLVDEAVAQYDDNVIRYIP